MSAVGSNSGSNDTWMLATFQKTLLYLNILDGWPSG
jgi:hypothetical protein